MSGPCHGRKGKSDISSLSTGGEDKERKSIFGRYSNAEMLKQLMGLARDPCNFEFARNKIQPLWIQTLRVREVMALSDTRFPWRKRKLEQLCKDKLNTARGIASDVAVQDNGTKISRRKLSYASSTSCLLNSNDSDKSFNQKITLESLSSTSLLTSEDIFQDKQVYLLSPFLDDAKDLRSSTKDLVILVDSDESENGSKPSSPENLNHQEAPLLDLLDATYLYNSPNMNGKSKKNLQPAQQSMWILNFLGDHFQRMVIPVGSCFQADVPEWTGPVERNHDGEDGASSDSRWLGTRIWPIEGGNMKTTARAVGKGRSGSCSCVSPGTIDCIRRHILEERLLLQCDLGPAYFSWKFDEMGEQAAKLWTLKEQDKLEALVNRNPQSYRKNFVKHVWKSFPHKSTKTIISYYLNVFIPRCISLQTRSCLKPVDSDEDEVDGYSYLKWGKSCQGKGVPRNLCRPGGTKTLQLRRRS